MSLQNRSWVKQKWNVLQRAVHQAPARAAGSSITHSEEPPSSGSSTAEIFESSFGKERPIAGPVQPPGACTKARWQGHATARGNLREPEYHTAAAVGSTCSQIIEHIFCSLFRAVKPPEGLFSDWHQWVQGINNSKLPLCFLVLEGDEEGALCDRLT